MCCGRNFCTGSGKGSSFPLHNLCPLPEYKRSLARSRGKTCCRDAWELFAFIEDGAGREGSENHGANFQDHWVLMLVEVSAFANRGMEPFQEQVGAAAGKAKLEGVAQL